MNRRNVLFASLIVLSLVLSVSTVTASPPYAAAPQGTPWLHYYQSQWGYILSDGSGWVLYSYAKDTPGQSNCYDTCAQIWQPYLVAYGATPQANWTDGFALGSIKRTDGYWQLTYNNIPLYYYAQDYKAGDAYGNGYGGVWSVVPIKYAPPAPYNPPQQQQPYAPPKPYSNGY
jgi:predicted lipoprotein with Yx(FWY)xxD motif